jgi:hypothetical protein
MLGANIVIDGANPVLCQAPDRKIRIAELAGDFVAPFV